MTRLQRIKTFASVREASIEIALAIFEIAKEGDAERMWESPTEDEASAVIVHAWGLADKDVDELHWGDERHRRAALEARHVATILRVGDSLMLDSEDLRKLANENALPDGLSVERALDLRGCTGLATLPDGLSVGGWLDLSGCTGLTELPDEMSVGGWLDLSGCTSLTELPDGLSVEGEIIGWRD